jgi:hypothetical protein
MLDDRHFSPTMILRSYFALLHNMGRPMPFLEDQNLKSALGMALMLNSLDVC